MQDFFVGFQEILAFSRDDQAHGHKATRLKQVRLRKVPQSSPIGWNAISMNGAMKE
jgi:hypothetical protein